MHHRQVSRYLTFICAATLALVMTANSTAQTVPGCGTLSSSGQYGPFDYRKDRDKLPIVDNAHFTTEIESLIRGKTSSVGAELDYTLRAFPNHHRALLAMMRLSERDKDPKPHGSNYTISCWFLRAVQFKPDDVVVRMLYAKFLAKSNQLAEAIQQLDIADGYAKDNAFTHYNIGLHFFDLKEYDKALIQAHKAIEYGYDSLALRERLQGVEKWRDPSKPDASDAKQSPANSVEESKSNKG